MKKITLIFVLLLSFSQTISAQEKASLPEIDRIRIAEAFRIGEKISDKVWKGWSSAPWALLLVTPKDEFLIRHRKPSGDFRLIGYDSLLKSDVYTRPRKLSPKLLATFPAAGDATPVIVVGQAENTDAKTSTPWVFVVLHEHFHQLQYSQPDYYADVEKLNLSGGDRTGMWMINYQFPYSQKEVGDQFGSLSKLLVETYNAKNKSQRSKKLNEYLSERKKFESILKTDDRRYLSFQLWQEGIARYVQYKTAQTAAKKYKPSKEFRALKDFTPIDKEADNLLRLTFNELKEVNLSKSQRIAFYPFGAIEGLLLDKVNPNWKKRYLADKFSLDDYFRNEVNE
ncbi:MAG: hypothetical protein H0X72_04330 [Acidobacteria bacterium]|jgi:hypothetical protein|nr:hypothetical protein [Acidobacteriota bacterium]